MCEKNIKKTPYGLANYERLVQKNLYYVDKTMFLQAVENHRGKPFRLRYIVHY
jgi:hypothetical protein